MTANDPNAGPLTSDQILAAIAAAGTSGGAGIGLAKGQKPSGVIENPSSMGGGHPGMPYVPGGPETQFYAPTNAHPYQEGAQWNPGAGTADQIAQLQGELVQAGLITSSAVRPGFWDARSADAYKVVLGYANVHAMNVNDAMAQFLANPQLQSAASAYRYPLALTSPVQMQSDFASAAQPLTGGGLPASEAQAFSSYQTGLEDQARQRYLSAKTDKNAAYVGAPSSTASARDYILAHNQQDVVNYDMALRTLQFQQALKEL
jgi:hypothetical protein